MLVWFPRSVVFSRFPRLLVLLSMAVLVALPIMPVHAEETEIVERWRGSLRMSNEFDSTELTFGMLPAIWRDRYTVHYDLTADETGFVSGDVTIDVEASSADLMAPVCLLVVLDCTLTITVDDPRGAYFVEGRREMNAAGEPVLVIANVITISPVKIRSSTCGSVFGLFEMQCTGDDSYEWTPYLPQDFVITPMTLNRPPMATPSVAYIHYDWGHWRAGGELIGTGEEPIVELDPELIERSIFISGISIDNQLDANIDWNTTDAGWLNWQFQSQVQQVGPTRAPTVPKTVDVGALNVGRTEVVVQAKNALGKLSQPRTTTLTAAPIPKWSEESSGAKTGDAATYKFSFRIPEPAFDAKANVPEIIPFFGAKPLGIRYTQFGADVEVKSTGEGTIKGMATSGFDAMGSSIAASFTLAGDVILVGSGVDIQSGSMEIGINGKISDSEPLFKAIPQFRPLLTGLSKISPAAAKFVEEKATIGAELEMKFTGAFKFEDEGDKIKLVRGEVTPEVGVKTALEVDLYEDVVKASVAAGINGSVTFQAPEPYFQKAELKGTGTAQLRIYQFTQEGEFSVSALIGGGLAAAALDGYQWDEASQALVRSMSQMSGNGWRLIDRSYLSTSAYGQWTATERNTAEAALVEPTDEVLVTAIWPEANPSLAVLGDDFGLDHAVLAWSHDRNCAVAAHCQEIMFSINDGYGWDTPVALTADERSDLNPHALLLPTNHALIGWQRLDTDTPGDFDADPAAYLSHMQVVAARAAQSATPVQLSASGSLNHRPQFGVTASGALAVWVNNAGNQILGDEAHPDLLQYAVFTPTNGFDGDVWSAPAPVLPPLAGLTHYSLATNGGHAALVYEQDRDGDLATGADRELYYTRFTNQSWSAPVRLTNNGVADGSPALALTDTGAPVLVWRQDGVLVWISAWNGTPRPLPLPETTAPGGYRLARGGDGSLALTWQSIESGDTRIGYAVYDPRFDRWSDVHTVAPPTGDWSMMANPSPALVSVSQNNRNDSLMFAYQLAAMTTVTKTIEGVAVPDVPVVAGYSLRVAQTPLRTNLTVTGDDLSVSPATGAPGQPMTIAARIRNTGHRGIENAAVILFHPAEEIDAEATILMTETVPFVAAGESYTVTFAVPRPAVGKQWRVEILPVRMGSDPFGPLIEDDLGDNMATLGSELGLELLSTVYVPDGAIPRVGVIQQGNLYNTANTTMTLHLDSATGPVLHTLGVEFPATPTAMVTATAWISATELGAGRHRIVWNLNPGRRVGEAAYDDNVLATTVNILPDLASVAELVGWESNPGDSAPFGLRVYNEGNWPSSGGVVAVYDGDPQDPSANLLLRLDLPDLAAGSYAELSGTLDLAGTPAAAEGLQGVYVLLDADDALEELSENNNLIAAGAFMEAAPTPTAVYLPVVRQ